MANPCSCALLWTEDSEASSFCQLPPSLAAKWGATTATGSQAILVLRFECADEGIGQLQEYSFFAAWNGAVGMSLRDSTVAVPLAVARAQLGGDQLPCFAKVYVEVSPPVATQVEIVPATVHDWEIAQNHAEMLEECILRRMAIVVRGEELQLHINRSISVKCVVAGVEAVGHLQDQGFPPPRVALLSTETAFLVAPTTAAAAVPSIAEPATPAITMQEALAFAALLHPLRILPQSKRGSITSLDCRHVKSMAGETMWSAPHPSATPDCLLDLDRLEASFLENDKRGDCLLDWSKDDIACLVNPHYFRCVADLAQNGNPNDVFIQLTSCRFSLGLLRRMDDNDHDVTVKPLASSVVVNVALCDSIRPGHISLPLATRKLLALVDFELVLLQVLDPSKLQDRRPPPKISLRPVLWSSSGVTTHYRLHRQHHDASPPPAPPSPLLLPSLDAVQSALVQMRDNSACSPFILCHGSVIDLSSLRGSFLVELEPSEAAAAAAEPSIVCIGDDNHFLRCLDAVSLLQPGFRAHLPAELAMMDREGGAHSQHSPRATHLVGFGDAMSAVLKEVLPCVCPLAVLDRIAFDTHPVNRLLITGALGAGKTAICREVASLLKECTRTLCHDEYLDCGTLLGQSMSAVTGALNKAFSMARRRAPAVLILDNLDAICPAAVENAGLHNQQAVTISQHLEELLESIREEMDSSHDAARALQREILPPKDVDAAAFAMDCIVSRALVGAVYVLGTAKSSTNLNYRLQRSRSFCKSSAVPSLSPEAGLSMLRAALAQLRVPLGGSKDDDDDDGSRVFLSLSAALEGLRPKDLNTLARRVFAVVTQRCTGTDRATSTQIDDVMLALSDFVPVSGRASTTMATGQHGKGDEAVSWKSVGGFDREKADLLDIFQKPLLFRALFQQSLVRMPRAALLYGPPGCGKTLLAQAAGVELGLTFMSVQGPQLLDKYIGASEKAVRDLFERAAANGRPTLVFFDEFEAMAPKRGRENTGVTDRVVNQLLTFLDGVEATMGKSGGGGSNQVYVLAATSRPDLIDVALLRPGRIEKHIYLGLPSAQDRIDILEAALRNLAVTKDVNAAVREVAGHPLVASFTAADLDALAKSAYLAAAHEELEDLWSGEPRGVVVQGKHLLAALQGARSSLSHKDLAFYSEIHAKFRGGEGQYPEAADAGQLELAKQRLTLM